MKNIYVRGEQYDTKKLKTGVTAGRLLTFLVALTFVLLLFGSTALAGSLEQTFTNNTGETAYDLHIYYNRQVKVISQSPKEFKKVKDGSKVDLSNGSVLNGNDITIEVEGDGDVKINKWYWTDKEHNRLGKIHEECVPQDGCTSSDETDTATVSGVVTVALNNETNLTLPADMRAGETVSGTIDEKSYAQNSDMLNGAVFDVGGKKYQLRNRILTFVVPAAVGAALPIILKDRLGREIGRKQIPINKNAGLTGSIPTQLGSFAPPRIGQAGDVIPIPSDKCNGVASDTKINFSDKYNNTISIPVVAESLRGIFARVPFGIRPGNGTLTIEKNGLREQFPFNSYKVNLRADNPNTNTGGQINIYGEITGLEGVIEDKCELILLIKNLSPSVVKFNSTSSDLITKKVNAMPGAASGVVRFNETLTGIGTGAFTIRAWLKAKAGDEPETPRDWVKKIAELKREAANRARIEKNSSVAKKLDENAEEMEKFADNDKNWDKDGNTTKKKGFKKFLEAEKERLKKLGTQADKCPETAKKIAEAMDAVDKAAEAAGVKLDEK